MQKNMNKFFKLKMPWGSWRGCFFYEQHRNNKKLSHKKNARKTLNSNENNSSIIFRTERESEEIQFFLCVCFCKDFKCKLLSKRYPQAKLSSCLSIYCHDSFFSTFSTSFINFYFKNFLYSVLIPILYYQIEFVIQ